jgi:MFS family permease
MQEGCVPIRDLTGRVRAAAVLAPGTPHRNQIEHLAPVELRRIDGIRYDSGWTRFALLQCVMMGGLFGGMFGHLIASLAGIAGGVRWTLIVFAAIVGVLVLRLAQRATFRRTYAAQHVAILVNCGFCPWCFSRIQTRTEDPVNRVTCRCDGVWPTVAAIQLGDAEIPQVQRLERENIISHSIMLALLTAGASLVVSRMMGMERLIVVTVLATIVAVWSAIVCLSRPRIPPFLTVACALPPIAFAISGLIQTGRFSMPHAWLAISLAVPAFLVGSLSGLRKARRPIATPAFQCPTCGYDLRGVTEMSACPECGTPHGQNRRA